MQVGSRSFVQAVEQAAHLNCGPRRRPGITSDRCTQIDEEPYFGGASLAALLVVYTRDIDLTYLGIIVPLLLVMYLTFKNSMARVEDANIRLEQMNTLYLSTIETLAMAVDAKDQITHGHIRRVQTYAAGLARELGLRGKDDLRAVEAAALLHDMGKLAIPEYILNKPGKLTSAEFEKMRLS